MVNSINGRTRFCFTVTTTFVRSVCWADATTKENWRPSRDVDFGFGFDDEDGVGVGAAGGAEFLAGFVEGFGEDGEDDFALGAADEVEAAFLLDELELGRHSRESPALTNRRLSTHGQGREILRFAQNDSR